jgi:hypothetical protein
MMQNTFGSAKWYFVDTVPSSFSSTSYLMITLSKKSSYLKEELLMLLKIQAEIQSLND